MSKIEKFEDLEIWQMSRELCKSIFTFIQRDRFSKDYKLINQINSSSGSVMDNIAEGFERGSRNEFIQFLGISKGSNAETRSQLYRALDRNYINEAEFKTTYDLTIKISKAINGLMAYLNTLEYKGRRFNNRVNEQDSDYFPNP